MTHAALLLPTPHRSSAPSRPPASPTDETERLADYALVVADLESCSGLLLVHADGSTECMESAGCPADLVLHTGTAPCFELGLDCC